MTKKKITNHAKYRIRQRLGIIKNHNRLIQNVEKYGKNITYYQGDFRKYLNHKLRKKNIKIKVYNESIYIFNKTNKKLITVYPVLPKYFPSTNYEVTSSFIDSFDSQDYSVHC